MKLKDQVAIVTGSANGIGRAIALRLASEGAKVVVADLDLEGADRVAEEIKALGSGAVSCRVNVTKNPEVQEMAETTLARFGKIDILVNNAGGSARDRSSLFCQSAEEVWDEVIARNLKSVFLCSRAVIEHMIQRQKGRIINISSCTGLVGLAGLVDYSSAKAGVIGFTHALAKEVASLGIRVNSVAPGPIATQAMEALPSHRFAQMTGLNRFGKPEEIAAMVAFLCTEEADFITGQVFPVCGLRNMGAL